MAHDLQQKYNCFEDINYLERFETEGRLGSGGCGVVFEARNKCDKLKYAVKRISLSRRFDILIDIFLFS